MVLSFSEAAAQAVQGTVCSLLAVNDEATKWINTAWGLDADFANINGALRKRVCNESDPDTTGVGPIPPFTGGQCNKLYRVVTKTGGDCNNPQTNINQIQGPIVFIGQDPESPNRVIAKNAAGVVVVMSQVSVGGTRVMCAAPNVSTVNGSPDDCGDPPEEVGDYNDYSETVSITYEDNSETTITEDVDVNIGPFLIGIGGAVYAPVTVTTGPIDIDGRVTVYPEFNIDISPFPPDDGPGKTDDPIPDPSEEDPEPLVEEREDRIIGVVVRVVGYDESIAKATFVAQDGTPDLYLPRVGNVSFFIKVGETGAWTEPVPVKTVNSYVPCLASQGAVSVDITEETGFTLEVSAVYASLVV